MMQGLLFSEDEIDDSQPVQTVVEDVEFYTAISEGKAPQPKQKQKSLFTREDMVQPPLTAEEKDCLIHRIINNAKLGVRYMYRIKNVCSMLRITYDEIQTVLKFYKLDCIVIKGTIIRIPWWSLAEYLIDPAEDVENAFQDYLKSLPHRKPETEKIA